MSKSKKIVSINNQLMAVILAIIGVLFCILRSGMVNILLTIAGVLLIIVGIINIVKKDLVTGIIELVLGVLIIVAGWQFLEIGLLIIGIVFIILGILSIVKGVSDKKKVIDLLNPILLTILGILLVVAKWALGDVICIIIGIYLIIYAILLFIGHKK